MAILTPRVGLIKPDPANDPVDVTPINTNMDAIDARLGYYMCTSTTRPTGASLYDGMPIFEKDTGASYVWDSVAINWRTLQ
jgi:hypothetical protein